MKRLLVEIWTERAILAWAQTEERKAIGKVSMVLDKICSHNYEQNVARSRNIKVLLM